MPTGSHELVVGAMPDDTWPWSKRLLTLASRIVEHLGLVGLHVELNYMDLDVIEDALAVRYAAGVPPLAALGPSHCFPIRYS